MQIGKYDVVGQVGAGSTGLVWLATQPEVDRPVAIKQLAPDLATDSSFRDRFRSEARVLASLTTPNIVAVYDYVEAPDEAYIVEEYVDGAPLARVVAEHGRLTSEQAVGVMRGALRGLTDAHDAGLVHGDVTPANILVTTEGVSKLIDFGLSVGSGTSGSSGTAAYASPEAVNGRPLDARSDVYSAGCVLYELLAGRPPFSAGTAAETAVLQVAAAPPELTGSHTRMRGVVGRAMAKDPAERFHDARELLEALEVEAARDLGADWELAASVAGLAVAAGVTTAGVTGAAASTTAPVVTSASAGHTAARATARGLRRIPKKWLIAGGATATVAAVAIAAVALSGGGSTQGLSGRWKVAYTVTDQVTPALPTGSKRTLDYHFTCSGGTCTTRTNFFGHRPLHLVQHGQSYTGTYSTLQTCPAFKSLPAVHGVGRIDDHFELTMSPGSGGSVTTFRGTDTTAIIPLKTSRCSEGSDRSGSSTLVGTRVGS